MERYKEAVAPMEDPEHHLRKYFNDADLQAYLAQRQDKDGGVRHLSPKSLWNRYTNKDLPYVRNTSNTFWFRFVKKEILPSDSGVDFDDITRRVLAMAWLKSHITDLEKAKDAQLAKAKSACSAQTSVNVVGSLLGGGKYVQDAEGEGARDERRHRGGAGDRSDRELPHDIPPP